MASFEPRRSTRSRKPIVTYAEEQAEQAELVVKRTAPKKRKQAVQSQAKEAECTEYVSCLSMQEGESDEEEDEEFIEQPVKKKRTMKASRKVERDVFRADPNAEANAFYNAPPPGTMISFWGNTKRKQPKLYYAPEKVSMAKKVGATIDESARARIDRQLASIREVKPGQEETRLRSFSNGLPGWYGSALEKAQSQKMFVLERSRGLEPHCHAHHSDCPYELIQFAGCKGDVYEVRIGHIMTCTCPVGMFSASGDEKLCKHVLYVLYNVLKAPDHLKELPAFLTSELKELFANAPPLPSETVAEDEKDGNRKEVAGDCPICFTDFEEDEAIVWCKAACGNNIHKKCFEQWAQAKHNVTCPFCRTPWLDDEQGKQKAVVAQVHGTERLGRGGYVNVFDQLDYD